MAIVTRPRDIFRGYNFLFAGRIVFKPVISDLGWNLFSSKISLFPVLKLLISHVFFVFIPQSCLLPDVLLITSSLFVPCPFTNRQVANIVFIGNGLATFLTLFGPCFTSFQMYVIFGGGNIQ